MLQVASLIARRSTRGLAQRSGTALLSFSTSAPVDQQQEQTSASDADVDAKSKKKATPNQTPAAITTTWHKLVVGEIKSMHPHPEADRLNICTVNIGDEDNLLQIICGAPNAREGAKVPVAQVGSKLAITVDGQPKLLKIKKSKLRGELSQGMICSEEELGLADKSDGIWIFDEDAPVGKPLLEYGVVASKIKQ